MTRHSGRCRPTDGLGRRGERGVVGGGESLALGLLILVGGTLALLNVWAFVDTRVALDSAAREYLRTYTESRDPATAQRSSMAAAKQVLELRGTPIDRLVVAAPDSRAFGPCEVAVVELATEVAWARVPFIDGVGSRTVRVVHSELIDPHREVIPGVAHDPTATMCADND